VTGRTGLLGVVTGHWHRRARSTRSYDPNLKFACTVSAVFSARTSDEGLPTPTRIRARVVVGEKQSVFFLQGGVQLWSQHE
jgi:hypothetical protein